MSETRAAPRRRTRIHQQLIDVVGPLAREAGLRLVGAPLPAGEEGDYRIPHSALLRPGPGEMYASSAPLVVEFAWLGQDPWENLSFYAGRGVDEVLIVDPQDRQVHWLALDAGEYKPVERSKLVELGPAELAERLDWPRNSKRRQRRRSRGCL